jgi:hypothetical protein
VAEISTIWRTYSNNSLTVDERLFFLRFGCLRKHKRLGNSLRKSSMPNKTVILTSLNHPWADGGMIDI